MSFGRVLSRLRMEKKIRQKVLAEFLNVSVSTISNYENDTHFPDLTTLCKIADYFHVTTDFLLERTKYRSDLFTLNRNLISDYTVSDFVNTIIEFDQRNIMSLREYIELLQLRENP
ncbi:MAG: helix-turn-helix domain-containing protein [Clostridium sp.]|nr:helix-turn-helix domain-containing protein [Clostridium sp.]